MEGKTSMKKATVDERHKTFIEIVVICPYCHAELVGVVSYAKVIACWHCHKDFRLINPEDVWDKMPEKKSV